METVEPPECGAYVGIILAQSPELAKAYLTAGERVRENGIAVDTFDSPAAERAAAVSWVAGEVMRAAMKAASDGGAVRELPRQCQETCWQQATKSVEGVLAAGGMVLRVVAQGGGVELLDQEVARLTAPPGADE